MEVNVFPPQTIHSWFPKRAIEHSIHLPSALNLPLESPSHLAPYLPTWPRKTRERRQQIRTASAACMPLSYQLRAHGTQIPIPLAHLLPSERATTFTDHSDLSTPVDASDGHRPAAQASPSAASVQSLSLSVPLSSANTSARKPLATVVQVAREREKRHARAKR